MNVNYDSGFWTLTRSLEASEPPQLATMDVEERQLISERLPDSLIVSLNRT